MKLKEITTFLEHLAPLSLQESYDNSGLLVGSPDKEVDKALITLDVTPEVMEEALETGAQLIISHHPVIFKGLKHLRGGNLVEDVVISAIKNDIALVAMHTNLDNVANGVNSRLARKLGLTHTQVLSPSGRLKKLVVFVPESHFDKVRRQILDAGAGHIGNYSHCSFGTPGEGSFKAGENTHPFVGKPGEMHYEKEVRLETIVPENLLPDVLSAMRSVHPYEEIAYDIYPLDNRYAAIGAGMVGELPEPVAEQEFLQYVKKSLSADRIRFGLPVNKPIKKVALCGGSGSFLMEKAFASGADVFVTADLKYHDFFLFPGQMLLVDAGHYETEQFTKELLFDSLIEKFPNFALQISKKNTNPVSYL